MTRHYSTKAMRGFPLLTFLCLLGICLAVFNVISKYHRILRAEDLKQTLLCHLPSFEMFLTQPSIYAGQATQPRILLSTL